MKFDFDQVMELSQHKFGCRVAWRIMEDLDSHKGGMLTYLAARGTIECIEKTVLKCVEESCGTWFRQVRYPYYPSTFHNCFATSNQGDAKDAGSLAIGRESKPYH